MNSRKLWSAWNHFWFDEGSPVPVAIFRILLGLLVVRFWAEMAPVARIYFGQHAIASAQTTASWLGCQQFDLLAFLPHDDLYLDWMMTALALAGVCLTLGFYSRLSALVCYVILTSLDSQNHFVLHTGNKILLIMLLFLSLSRCGEAFSLDRLIRRWRSPTKEFEPIKNGNVIGQRLIQVQLALVYWGAFSCKLHGHTWTDGTAVYYAAHIVEFQHWPVPYVLDHLWTCQILSWSTLILECAMCTLIWIKELRYPLLFCGAAFHIGLGWALEIPVFQEVMIACYVCFIEPEDLSKMIRTVEQLAAKFCAFPCFSSLKKITRHDSITK